MEIQWFSLRQIANKTGHYLDITNCITGIICGYKFNSIYFKIISDYAKIFNVDAYKLNYKNGYPGFDKI